MRGNKGLIGAKSNVNLSGATGVFSLTDQQLEKGQSNWPFSGGDFSISPSVNGSTFWDFTASGDLNLTSNGEYTVTCLRNFTAVAQMWGAGGARGHTYNGNITDSFNQGPGGGGGHSNAVINFIAGETFLFRVGQGGARSCTASSGATYLAGGIQTTGASGTQGGGYSGIFKNTATQANAYLIAGGGGGGGDSSYSGGQGGAGGGSSGDNSGDPGGQGGGGGTQLAGGIASTSGSSTAGSALIGGIGGGSGGLIASQGGGGGGYYGGGGGHAGGGGGGSGFFSANTTILIGRTLDGAANTAAVATLANSAGEGGSASRGNTGADGRLILEKVKTSSIYLDGTGDYITFSATGDFAKDAFFGSGKTFTVEAWIYPTSLVTEANYFSIILGDGNPTGIEMCWNVGMNDAKKPAISWYDGTPKSASVSTALTLNTWTHVAWVASAGTVSIYVNGVSQALSGTTTLTNSSQSVGIEIGVDRSRAIAGYISNLRAVKGTAIYTSNFTAPTTPLTAVSGTALLLATNQLSSLDWSQNKYALTFTGNATTTRSVIPF